MQIAVFGSCMSNLTAAKLCSCYGWKQTHSVHHNRSDAFIRYFIEESADTYSLADLDRAFILKADAPKDAKFILRNQGRETIGLHELEDHLDTYGNFVEHVKSSSVDVILLDNFMDVASKLVFHRVLDPDARRPLFLNTAFYQDSEELTRQYHHTSFLTPRESAENWLVIYKWLRLFQPKAKIIFLPYHYCSSTQNTERYLRIYGFYQEFKDLCGCENIHLIPPLNVDRSLTKGEEDWPHFHDSVYQALAGHIFLMCAAGLGDKNFAA